MENDLIEAGIARRYPEESIYLSRYDLMVMPNDELEFLATFDGTEFPEYSIRVDRLLDAGPAREIRILISYPVPCITAL